MTPYEIIFKTNEKIIKGEIISMDEKREISEALLQSISDKNIIERFYRSMNSLKELICGIQNHFEDKKRHSGTAFYYRLTLSELPPSVAVPEISGMKNMLLQQLAKSYVMNSENDRYINVLAKYILRNCLSKLTEFEYLKEREPFVSEKDGRLYFDISSYRQTTFS